MMNNALSFTWVCVQHSWCHMRMCFMMSNTLSFTWGFVSWWTTLLVSHEYVYHDVQHSWFHMRMCFMMSNTLSFTWGFVSWWRTLLVSHEYVPYLGAKLFWKVSFEENGHCTQKERLCELLYRDVHNLKFNLIFKQVVWQCVQNSSFYKPKCAKLSLHVRRCAKVCTIIVSCRDLCQSVHNYRFMSGFVPKCAQLSFHIKRCAKVCHSIVSFRSCNKVLKNRFISGVVPKCAQLSFHARCTVLGYAKLLLLARRCAKECKNKYFMSGGVKGYAKFVLHVRRCNRIWKIIFTCQEVYKSVQNWWFHVKRCAKVCKTDCFMSGGVTKCAKIIVSCQEVPDMQNYCFMPVQYSRLARICKISI
jgi:hypothetical protein